jgi:hypothetical protein
VLDLQGCQTKGSRGRGIGRYSRSLAEALVTSAREFDFTVCLNDAFVDSADELTREFEPLVGKAGIVRYDAPCGTTPWDAAAMDPRRVAGEWIAQYAWIAQRPDLVHISSVFEGLDGEAAVPDLVGLPGSTVVSATAYDVIPLIYADTYLVERNTRD